MDEKCEQLLDIRIYPEYFCTLDLFLVARKPRRRLAMAPSISQEIPTTTELTDTADRKIKHAYDQSKHTSVSRTHGDLQYVLTRSLVQVRPLSSCL